MQNSILQPAEKKWTPTDEVRLIEPFSWRKPARVFVNSMSDLFHEAVPFDFIDKVFAVMALCPRHTFQVLTKRPERMAEYLNDLEAVRCRAANYVEAQLWVSERRQLGWGDVYNPDWPLRNVWLGTSCENQAAADERIPHLLKCPAAVRFLSCEPLLGPIDLGFDSWWHEKYDGTAPASSLAGAARCRELIHWVIVGGESGKARACDVAWIRSIVSQCKAAGVPCFVKQLGARVVCRNDEVCDRLDDCHQTDGVLMQGDPVRVMLRNRKGGDPSEWPEDLRVREWPRAAEVTP